MPFSARDGSVSKLFLYKFRMLVSVEFKKSILVLYSTTKVFNGYSRVPSRLISYYSKPDWEAKSLRELLKKTKQSLPMQHRKAIILHLDLLSKYKSPLDLK